MERKKYLALLMEKLLPEVVMGDLAEYCDVFCDRGAFTVGQSRKTALKAKEHGLRPRLHAEQLSRSGATQVAVELGSGELRSPEQVNEVDNSGAGKIGNGGDTFARMRFFHLGLKQYAPARKLIEAGAIVGLATDYNPGTSPTVSMPMILSLACSQLRMTPAERLRRRD